MDNEETWQQLTVGGAAKGRRGRKKTGGSVFQYGTSEQRVRIAYQVAQNFKRDFAQPDKPKHYLRYMTSLLVCLKECGDSQLAEEAKETLKKILPLLDLDPFISFYLILQPYRGIEMNPLVSEDLISAWVAGHLTKNIPEDDTAVKALYLGFFDSDLKDIYKAARIDQGQVEEAIDRLRVDIDKKPPREARGEIDAAYDKLQATGKIGDVQAIPVMTCKCLADCQLAWQDTFRITIGARFDTARRRPNHEEFQKLLEFIYCSMPGNDFEGELTFLSESTMKYNVGSRFDLLMLYKFMNSSDFLYRANASTEAGAPSGTLDPSSDEIYNRNGYVMRWMGNLLATASSAQTLQKDRGGVRALEAM
jgi:hypothetical protein